jgi:hypothetical protein
MVWRTTRKSGFGRIFLFLDMANIITASIYSYQANPNFTDQYGVTMAFSPDKSIIRQLSTPIVFQGVPCQSTIEVVSGSAPFRVYFAAESASTLINP